MSIKTILSIAACLIFLSACNIEPNNHEATKSKTISQLDTVWKEVVPFKEKYDILDADTVLIGTSDSMMQKYNASLERLDGIITNIAQQVKHYDKQPLYWLEAENTGGPYMLFEINGIPLSYAFTKRQPDHRIDYLNPYIEKSGKQTLKIRAFASENASFEKRWYKMSVRIGYGADKRELDAAPEYLTDIITLPDYVLDNGTQYWDTTITFNAEVPWDHSDRLVNAVDLRILPDLEERVLRKYGELRQYFVNCDIAGIYEVTKERIIYKKESLYKTSLKDLKKDTEKRLLTPKPNHPDKKVFPIRNYELVLYKHGKIALLRGIYDKSAVIKLTEYDPEAYPEPYEVKWHVFLFMPEGETQLQVY